MLLNHLFHDGWVVTPQVSLGLVRGICWSQPRLRPADNQDHIYFGIYYIIVRNNIPVLCWRADLHSLISQHELMLTLKCVADSSYMKGFQKPFTELVLRHSALHIHLEMKVNRNLFLRSPTTDEAPQDGWDIDITSDTGLIKLLNSPCL
jgi:hypothetical protein